MVTGAVARYGGQVNHLDVDLQTLLESPVVAVGTLSEVCEKLTRVRNTLGFNYFVTPYAASMEALATDRHTPDGHLSRSAVPVANLLGRRSCDCGLSFVPYLVDLAQKRLGCRTDLTNRHRAQRMYRKNERDAIVGVEYRRRDRGDWVRAAGAVVGQRVGRGEFHPQLVDDGTQIVGDRSLRTAFQSLGPPGSTRVSSSRCRSRAHACGSTRCAGAGADPHRRQRRGESRPLARLRYPRRRRRYRMAAHTGCARWAERPSIDPRDTRTR